MAVHHHHVLALHPFGPASGPTGRVVNLLALMEAGLIEAPYLNLRRYLRRSRGSYERRLAGVTIGGEWQPWLVSMPRATEAAAWRSEKIRAIRAVLETTAAQARTGAPKQVSPERVELIFLAPYCRIGALRARRLGERHCACAILKERVRLGALRAQRAWREKIFLICRYLDPLASEPGFGPYRQRAVWVAAPQGKVQAA